MSDSFNSTQAFEPLLDESGVPPSHDQPNDSMFPSTQAFDPPPNQSQSFDSIAEADRIIERSLMNFRDETPLTQAFDVSAEGDSLRHDAHSPPSSPMGQTQAFEPEQSHAADLDDSDRSVDHVVDQTQAFDVEHSATQAFDVEHDQEEAPGATQAFELDHEQEDATINSPEPISSPAAQQREDTDDADGPQSPDEEPGDAAVDDEADNNPTSPATPASPASGDDDDDSPRKRRRLVISDDEDEDSDAEGAARAGTSGGASAEMSSSAQVQHDDDDKNSDVPNDDDAKSEVGELIADIFGESENEKDSDEEGDSSHAVEKRAADDDDDEVRVLGVGGADHHHAPDFEWDFDVMLRKKKEENRKQRKRRRDGSIDLLSDADDQIKELIEAMKTAAKDDRHSNTERKPALQKRKMLPFVKSQLRKADLAEALIDNGIMSVVSEWLAPLPDKSLPALEIRTELLKILQQYARLEQSVLRQSGLGKAVMLLYKHPRETKENKQIAARLISEWARPIFQLETDFRALSREERVQRDFEHMPQAKKRRLSVEDGRQKSSDAVDDDEAPSRPGDKGWIGRARVPRPSTKDYVVRPKPNVEGQFRGESGSRKTTTRYDRKLRELKDRTKPQKTLHAVGVSIEGRKMTY